MSDINKKNNKDVEGEIPMSVVFSVLIMCFSIIPLLCGITGKNASTIIFSLIAFAFGGILFFVTSYMDKKKDKTKGKK